NGVAMRRDTPRPATGRSVQSTPQPIRQCRTTTTPAGPGPRVAQPTHASMPRTPTTGAASASASREPLDAVQIAFVSTGIVAPQCEGLIAHSNRSIGQPLESPRDGCWRYGPQWLVAGAFE